MKDLERYSKITEQALLVSLLTKRLGEDLNEAIKKSDNQYSLEGYTRIQTDIVRIRRELNSLSIILGGVK